MILCTGEAVIDLFQKPVEGLGEVFYPLPGGCAYNTSIAISRLGVPAAFLGRLSTGLFGEIQIKRLRENNVRRDFLIRDVQNTVLAFIKTEKNKEPQYAFYTEGTVDRLLSAEELPETLPADITCIMFGSISTVMEPIAATIENFILKEAKQRVIAFDPNIRPFVIKDRDAYLRRFEKLAGVSTIVKISLEDFEFIQPNPKPQPEAALEKLTAWGTRLAIVTMGPQGAMAMLRKIDGSLLKVSVPGVQIPKVADTVGAGDTFHGAFLARLEMKKKMSHNAIARLSESELIDALAFANKAAACVCTQHGCEPPSLKEITAEQPIGLLNKAMEFLNGTSKNSF